MGVQHALRSTLETCYPDCRAGALIARAGIIRGMVISGTVALVLASLSMWFAIRTVRQLFTWPLASATILRYWITRSEGKPHGQQFFHPVFTFLTSDRSMITTISSWGSWRRVWPKGHQVLVRYDPTKPRCAEIQSFANLWGISLTLMALAAAVAFVGLLRLRL